MFVFLHFSLESFDLVGGVGRYNVQIVFSIALYFSIFTLLYFQHFCLESLICVVVLVGRIGNFEF